MLTRRWRYIRYSLNGLAREPRNYTAAKTVLDYFGYNLTRFTAHFALWSRQLGHESAGMWQTSLPSGSHMSGMRKEQRVQAIQEPLRTPLEFVEGRLRHKKRRRNRRYRLAGFLLILGVVTGV